MNSHIDSCQLMFYMYVNSHIDPCQLMYKTYTNASTSVQCTLCMQEQYIKK